MCGIVGYTHPREVDRDVLTRMTACLATRGPDAQGEFAADDNVFLGHRHLSIQDLSSRAKQPMGNDDRSVHLTYNGECYNHRELRALMPERFFYSTGDTETILRLYEKFGEEFIHKIIGMFAIAIYDKTAGKLILYRDRLGEKPLYYARAGKALLFASDPKAFLHHPWFSRDVDAAAVEEYFTYNYLSGKTSIYRDVRQLPPGHYLVYTFKTGRFTVQQYWSPRDSIMERHEKLSDEEHEEKFQTLFFDAVKRQTISDVPLGCFLSGGIDSSAVAYALTKAVAGRVKTFNIGFVESEYDESPFAHEVAQRIGTSHRFLRATAEDCIPLIEELSLVCGEPFADPSILPTMLLARMTKREVTVALSGDGGDELFLGYDRYAMAERVEKTFRNVPGALRRAGANLASLIPNYRVRMIAEGLKYNSDKDLYASVFIGWNRRFVQKLLRPTGDSTQRFERDYFHRLLIRGRNLTLVEQAAFADLQHYLPNDVMTKVDRASMHYSLESRAPMLDHRLVECALQLPLHLKMRGDRQKIILKQLLADVLPAHLINRPKAGFAVPLRHWFRGKLKPMMRDLLSPAELRAHGFFDEKFVQDLMRDHLSGKWNFERQLWALIVFQLWHRAQKQ